jgi:predicted nucleic acid-binding protein
MNVFLDTSALVKLYHQENGTEKLNRFLSDSAENIVIAVSDLTLIELHSVLMSKYRNGEIKFSDLRETLDLIEIDFHSFNTVKIDILAINLSLLLIDSYGSKHNLRSLDSIQLASAIMTDMYLPLDYFISSDFELLKIAKENFNVWDPLSND